MDYDIRRERVASRPLAVVRRRASLGEISKVVPEACGAVWNVIRARRVAGAGRHVTVYLDDRINLEVGVELNSPFAGCGEVIGSATPSGPVATTTHRGPYALLRRAHAAIRRWCEENGHTPAGPSWEIYGHWDDAWNDDPAKISTDVF